MKRTQISGIATALLLTFLLAPMAAAASESKVLATGAFEGRSDHIVSGSVALLSIGDAVLVVLGANFSLDGAPDPKVALGKNGYDPSTLLTALESKDGAQVYQLPKTVRVEEYNEVWIWCEKFDVPLGVASLKAAAPGAAE